MTEPYGSWPSPLSAAQVAEGGTGLSGPAVRPDADGRTEVWWAELRPSEGGRSVLVRRRSGGEPVDMLAAPWSARTRVHEYGGGAWFLGKTAVYFSNWDDQRLYRFDDERPDPQPLTPEPERQHGLRYADGVESPDGRWVVAVQETHPIAGEAINEIVVLPADGSEPPRVIVAGTDFVMAPRISPDGRWLSWIRWNHPDMPWDSTELCAAPLFDGFRLGNTQVVAGGPSESVHGANWASDERLVFSTDASGWWNLSVWRPGEQKPTPLTALVGSEIGSPPWVFGVQQWAELPDGRLLAVETTRGTDRFVVVSTEGRTQPLGTPYVSVGGLVVSHLGELIAVAQTKIDLPAVVEIAPGGQTFTHRPSDELGIDPRWYSVAEPIEFPTAEGRTAYGFLYEPTGPDRSVGTGGEDGAEKPPLIVIGHGGPTAHSAPVLNLKIQYWTSRGFAVVDVNYGGSTGHGRDYRRLLDRSWGIVDVQDCIAAATWLAAAGNVDPGRMAIRGGSAGGFTVLACLTSSTVFAAGTSLYGVADLEALARDTHKFESRYLDGLIGAYPAEQALYQERSPINHIGSLSCPLLVLQGTEDEIVPPNQAEAIVASLAAKGIPHAAIYFEGEQHGFRRAENIVRSLEAELWFYGRVFGFEPADSIEPVAGAVGL